MLLGLISFMVLVMVHVLDHKLLQASGQEVFQDAHYWKAWTTSLVHADLNHLFHNAFFFTVFSVLLNAYFGWFMFPFMSFIMGGIINMISLKFYEPHVYLVGISGVIYFMVAFWMVLYVGIDRKLTLSRRIINALAISLILFFPQGFEARVSYLAHGAGFAVGAVLGLLYFAYHRQSIRNQEVWVEVPEDPIIIEVEDYGFTTLSEEDKLAQ